MSNQSDKHAELLTILSATGLTYEQAWHTYWDELGIAAGNFNERMLAWINSAMTASFTDVSRAMQEYAEDQGFYDWDSMNDMGLPALVP